MNSANLFFRGKPFLPAAKPLVLERPELLLWWCWGDQIERVVYLIAPHYKFSPEPQSFGPNFAFFREALAIL